MSDLFLRVFESSRKKIVPFIENPVEATGDSCINVFYPLRPLNMPAFLPAGQLFENLLS